jgi:hypothetical protein
MPGWTWVVVLVLLVVALGLVARRLNRFVDDLQPDAAAQRRVTVWLNTAFALRRDGPDASFGAGGGGETLAGPRAGDRVAGKDA